MTPEIRMLCEIVGEFVHDWKRGVDCDLDSDIAAGCRLDARFHPDGAMISCECGFSQHVSASVPFPKHSIMVPDYTTPSGHARLRTRTAEMKLPHRMEYHPYAGVYRCDFWAGINSDRAHTTMDENLECAFLRALAKLAKAKLR